MEKYECPYCGKSYFMGYDGTVDGCDSCLGVERDDDGNFWYPDEEIHVTMDVNSGETKIVHRESKLRFWR